MSGKTTIESVKIERIPRAQLPVVSMDITASAASGYLLLAQPKNNPKSQMIRLRSKVDHQTVTSARNQLVEQTLRLRMQQMGQLVRDTGYSKPADLWSLSLRDDGKYRNPKLNRDSFFGTIFEGLPTLPVAVSYNPPTTMAAPVRSLKVTLPSKKIPSLTDRILATATSWLNAGKNAVLRIGSYKQRDDNAGRNNELPPRTATCAMIPDVKVQPKLTPMQELLNSFPTSLQPAVVELSKAVFCLSQSEVDVLVSSVDWRTRKLIQMISKARV